MIGNYKNIYDFVEYDVVKFDWTDSKISDSCTLSNSKIIVPIKINLEAKVHFQFDSAVKRKEGGKLARHVKSTHFRI